MTALEDLTDVGDLSGAADGDYLAYDQTSGLWIPQTPPDPGSGSGAEWVRNQGTLTYPSGDNGWTYVADERSSPVQARHVQNTTSIPSGDNALVKTVNVTSAMVNVGGTAGLQYPITTGLKFSISGIPVNHTGSMVWRMALERNGTQVAYQSYTLFSTRARAAQSLTCDAADGDTIKVHSWITSDANGDGLDLELFTAAPLTTGFNVPANDTGGNLLWVWLPTVPTFQLVETGPEGVDVEVSGTATPTTNHRLQSGTTAGSTTTDNVNRVLFGIMVPHGTNGTPYYNPLAANATSIEAGDPYVFRAHQYTGYDFWTLQTDIPAGGS